MPDPDTLRRLADLLPAARALGFAADIEATCTSGGTLVYPALGLSGPLDLTVSPSTGDDGAPMITIFHKASGLALLQSFVDPDDASPRNVARSGWSRFWTSPPSRADTLCSECRLRYRIPVTAKGLALARKALRALLPLADWTTTPRDPTLAVAVYEAVWPVLEPLALPADRAALKRYRATHPREWCKAVYPWLYAPTPAAPSA